MNGHVSALRSSLSSGQPGLCTSSGKALGLLCRGKACALKERAVGWQAEVSKAGRRQLELGVQWTFWERQE